MPKRSRDIYLLVSIPIFLAVLGFVIQTFADYKENYNHEQKEDIRQSILKNMGHFQKCYSTYLDTGGKSAGKMVLAWIIGPKGQAEKPRTHVDEIKDERFTQCLIKALSQIKFKAPPKGVVPDVSYPFEFKTQP